MFFIDDEPPLRRPALDAGHPCVLHRAHQPGRHRAVDPVHRCNGRGDRHGAGNRGSSYGGTRAGLPRAVRRRCALDRPACSPSCPSTAPTRTSGGSAPCPTGRSGPSWSPWAPWPASAADCSAYSPDAGCASPAPPRWSWSSSSRSPWSARCRSPTRAPPSSGCGCRGRCSTPASESDGTQSCSPATPASTWSTCSASAPPPGSSPSGTTGPPARLGSACAIAGVVIVGLASLALAMTTGSAENQPSKPIPYQISE